MALSCFEKLSSPPEICPRLYLKLYFKQSWLGHKNRTQGKPVDHLCLVDVGCEVEGGVPMRRGHRCQYDLLLREVAMPRQAQQSRPKGIDQSCRFRRTETRRRQPNILKRNKYFIKTPTVSLNISILIIVYSMAAFWIFRLSFEPFEMMEEKKVCQNWTLTINTRYNSVFFTVWSLQTIIICWFHHQTLLFFQTL